MQNICFRWHFYQLSTCNKEELDLIMKRDVDIQKRIHGTVFKAISKVYNASNLDPFEKVYFCIFTFEKFPPKQIFNLNWNSKQYDDKLFSSLKGTPKALVFRRISRIYSWGRVEM